LRFTIFISAKIRCLNTVEETIEFAKRMEKTGISALALHGRKRSERPRENCRDDFIQKVADALTIPVIANGGSNVIKVFYDMIKLYSV
jgi:tRNA-dihydrouridine synthase 2